MNNVPPSTNPILCKQDILNHLNDVNPTYVSMGFYCVRNAIPTGIAASFLAFGSQELLDIAYEKGYFKERGLNIVRWIFPHQQAYLDFSFNMGVLGAVAITLYTLYKKLYPLHQTELIKQKLAHLSSLTPITANKLKEVSDYSGIDLFKALNGRYGFAQERIVDHYEQSPVVENHINSFEIQLLENMYGEIMGRSANFSSIFYQYRQKVNEGLIEDYLIDQITPENKETLTNFALVNGLEELKGYCEDFR